MNKHTYYQELISRLLDEDKTLTQTEEFTILIITERAKKAIVFWEKLAYFL